MKKTLPKLFFVFLLLGGIINSGFSQNQSSFNPPPATPGTVYVLYKDSIGTLNPITGVITKIGQLKDWSSGSTTTGLGSLSINTEGQLFAIGNNFQASNPPSLVQVDPSTGLTKFIGQYVPAAGTSGLKGIAFDQNNVLYGIEWAVDGRDVSTVNITNASNTLVHDNVLPPSWYGGLEYRRSNGLFYVSDWSTGKIHVLNPTTGVNSIVFNRDAAEGNRSGDVFFDEDENLYLTTGNAGRPALWKISLTNQTSTRVADLAEGIKAAAYFGSSSATAPTVTTTTASSITSTSAQSGGNVTSDGGSAVTARGVAYGTTTAPTTGTSNGTGTGTFTSSLTGLTPNTLYYYRAFATNSVGTTYGAEMSFTTAAPAATAPTVTTTTASSITSTSAQSGGNVTSDGGSAISARGVAYGTTTAPTTGTSNGTGTGSFTSALTGLTPNTLYYYRAYATNSVGTTYGTEMSFTTAAPPATTPGAALNFDGSNDRVEVINSNANLANRSFSVEMWLKRGTPGTPDIAFSQGGGTGSNQTLHIGFRSNGDFTFAFYGNDFNVTVPSDALWHQWTCTFDNATKIQKIYRDGVLLGQRTSSSAFIGSGNTNLYIGYAAYGLSGLNPDPFRGDIDEVRVWDRVLCQAEITNNLNCEIPTTGTGLLANYHFNQGVAGGGNTSETTLNDASGNNNHGTLQNFALTGPTSNWVAPGGVVSGTTCVPYLGPEINLQGNSITIVDGDVTPSTADHTDFGSVQTGSNIERTYTIQNTGGANLNVGAITVTGANANQFTAASLTPPSPIAPNGSATFTLTFAPTSAGQKNATVNIVNDDCDENPYDFAIRGNGITAPTVTTTTASSITSTSAQSGGNVTSDGGSAVTARGVAYGTTTAPTTGTSNGTGTGTFTSSLTGLTPNTLYYYRAFATNSVGTTYGAEMSFTTAAPAATAPTVTTTTASSITSTSAQSGGNVTSDGGSAVTARGVAYGTTTAPTTGTSNGTGTGTFTSSLTGLTPNTLYYYRAFATNSVGTTYGAEMSFTTAAPAATAPTVTTTTASSITSTSAQSGGNVTSDGGSAVTARGVAYGTTTAPTTGTSNGTGTGTFTSLLTGLTPNTLYYYRAFATNSVGTTYGAEMSFTTAASAITLSTNSSNASCNGGNNGSATVNASGGTSPYTYAWSNGATTSTINNLSAGTYNVTVTDASGGANSASVTITEPSAIMLTTSSTGVSCNGGNNGSATVTATGGTSPYSYEWSNGGSTSTINNLPPGTYNVTVTDAAGCTKTASVTINDPSPITLNTSSTNVSCNDGNNGSATVTPTGGLSPYTYVWSNGATRSTINNLRAGSYSVTVTDAGGCTKSATVTITAPSPITLNTSTTNVNCNGGSNGSATVTTTGGTSPYTYAWSNGATTATINNLSAGSYNVLVTDAAGCTKTASITITEPPSITIITSSTDATCNANNGSATVNASGGTAPYTYLWSNGATTQAINNLSAGIYSVTVTDEGGCTKSANVTVASASSAVNLTTNSTNVSCGGGSNGSATVTATGGTSPYTYAWSNGATTATINNLSAGSYNVLVTDAAGCTKTATVTITAPSPITLNTSSTNVSCNGSNGSATVTATGGTSPYTYAWSNGATTPTINNLPAGTYNVTVTDAAGCTKSASVTITAPSPITLNTSTTNVNCNGGSNGSATVTATGGTSPYTYAWSNGATTSTINNLSAGIYNVTVTEAAGCTKTASVTITEPPSITITTSSTNATCNANNGSATVNASGGTAPYTYLWSNGATTQAINNLSAGIYSVTVTDEGGCTKSANVTVASASSAVNLTTNSTNVSCNGGSNGSATVTATGGTSPYTYAWSNGATTATINNLSAGSYNVLVTDAAGCTKTATATITAPSPITLNTSTTNVSCNGSNGSATVNTTGGTSPYTYAWSNGATTSTINNLPGGTYNVTVTDAAGCTKTASVTITAPSPITLNTSSTNVSCNGGSNGSATVTATGGTSPYTYTWSNGATTSSINNLPAGTYNVTVTDAAGCTKTATVTITAPSPITLNTSTTNVSCNGSNGSATVTATGGTSPYTYAWSNGATTSTINNLPAGTYNVTVTDAGGCTKTATVTITAPSSITLNTSSTNASCNGGSNGSATVTATGGTSPYTYAWSNGATTPTINNLRAGTYNVTVTDAAGCVKTATVSISSGPALFVNLGPDRTLCFGQTATLNGTVNFPGVLYKWTSTNGFSASSPTIVVSNTGSYYLEVSTPSGCVAKDTINITATTEPISSDFIMASQGFKDSLVNAINIALPSPDSVEWIIPNNPNITVQSKSKQKAEFKFSQLGTYSIGMKAYRGQCFSITDKQIVILEGTAFTTPSREPLIKQFTIAPNPNNGQFTVKLVLRENTAVRLRIIDFTNNVTINDRSLAGAKDYTESYMLNVVPGTYVIMLETAKETRSQKIIIQ